MASLTLTACVTERVVESAPLDSTTTRSTTVSTFEPGYVTQSLPTGYATRTVSGNQYYVADDVYYSRGPSGYTVVDRPNVVGGASRNPAGPGPSYVSTLPVGYTTRAYRGQDYYYSNGQYYRQDPRGYLSVDAPY